MCDLMKLKDISFNLGYDTNFDKDVLNNFYIPALSVTTCYRRMAGFFTSTSLAVAAEGIESLIKNNGKIQLLASPHFSDEDLIVLNTLYGDFEVGELIIDRLCDEIDSEFIKNEHTEALGWMLANNKLELRIVVVKNESGICLDNIFHNKIGIMTDGDNTVVFSGSINESKSGWTENIEDFDVFCDWHDDNSRIQRKISNFEKYWDIGETQRSITIELPEAIKNQWVNKVPKNMSELKIFKKIDHRKTTIRSYQKEAIQNWFDNNCRGIFNMATGTGKTITAVYAIKKLFDKEQSKKVLVIAVPLQHLVEDPWIKTIESELFYNKTNAALIRAFGSSKKWLPEANKALENLRFGIINHIIIVTTYDTLSSENMISIVRKAKGKKVIIADEVHNSGSKTYREGLLEDFDYRLGLSATPARYLDDCGTNFIQNYFDKEVYTFTLERAINEVNPDTGETYLTPYYYHPIFISLNKDEIKEYREYSHKLAKFMGIEEMTPIQEQQYTMLLINRSRIIKNAHSKFETLKTMIPELEQDGFIDHCLIYCSDGKDPEEHERTLTKVILNLNKNSISNRRFTSEESAIERQQILRDFETSEIRALVAIKCLDEGVDVPATKNAIIMASTGNPREYIQRRGRVLRRSKNKEFATIFDFIVVPNSTIVDWDSEMQIFDSELKRFNEFSSFSLNRKENNKIIETILEKYNMERSN